MAPVLPAYATPPETDYPSGGGEIALADALQMLRDQGMNLIFSTVLVKPGYRVHWDSTSGASEDGEARVRALLAPFGLGLQNVGPDTWYVVASAAAESPLEIPAAPSNTAEVPAVEQVLVTSSRYRLVRDLHDETRLEQQDLKTIPSIGRDLLRSINQLTGQASSGFSARNHIRGGNTDEVMYLVDGVQVIEPFHMTDFYAFFSAINPGLVDSIDVYTAGFPVTYGSRLSGVVDMEIQPASKSLSGQLEVNLISTAAQIQGYRNNLEWLVSGRRSVVDKVLGVLDNDYGKPYFHDEMVRLAWEGDSASIAAGLLASNDELKLRNDDAGENAKADYHSLATWFLGEYSPVDPVQLSLAASYTRVDNKRSGTLDDPLDAQGRLVESRKFTVVTARPSLVWRMSDGWLLSAGIEGQYQQGDFDVAIETRYGPLGTPLQPSAELQRDVTESRDGTLFTGFLSLQHLVTDRLQLEYGIRYDLQDIDPVHDNQLSPRIQINYQATPRLRLFANIGRYTQQQNLYELQLDDGLLELSPPQIADQMSLGADWGPAEKIDLRLEAYTRSVDDPRARFENIYNPWVLLPELHADRVGLSPDKALARGAELTIRYQFSEALSGTVGYAHANTEERLQGNWRPRPWHQHQAARLFLEWQQGQWRVSANAAWHTGWPNTSRLTEPPDSSLRLYDRELSDYFSLDLHVARRFELQSSQLELYLDLSNSTFRKNVGGYRYEQRDNAIVADERHLLPTFPVLGVAWTW